MKGKTRRLTIRIDEDNNEDKQLLYYLDKVLPKSERGHWIKTTLAAAALKKMNRLKNS